MIFEGLARVPENPENLRPGKFPGPGNSGTRNFRISCLGHFRDLKKCTFSGPRKTRFFAHTVEKRGVLAESRRFFSVPRILASKKKSFGLDHGRAFFQKLVA